MGVLNIAVSYGIVYWTETVLPSGVTSVLWAVFPLMMAISGHWLLQNERLRPAHWLGSQEPLRTIFGHEETY